MGSHVMVWTGLVALAATTGPDRALAGKQVPAHFASEVKVKVGGPEGNRTYRGVLSQVTSEGFTVDSEEGRMDLAYSDVLAATTIFRWEKAPKPGH